MAFYPVLFISFFLIAFLIRWQRHVFYALAEHSVSVVDDMMSSGLEEDAKLKLVQKGTQKLVYSLLKMFLLIIVALAAGAIPVAIYLLMARKVFADLDFTSFYSILSLSLGATVPFLIPVGKKSKSGYSELSQLLHRMALNNYHLDYRLFKRETRKIKKRDLQRRKDFVIVSGLARAGTTSLMNDLLKIDHFVSLSYANMPFLMCPNFWRKIYRPKTRELKERSHKDGIMIGLDSNEALEEFFFKAISNDYYIHESHLSEYKVSEQDYMDYLDYQTIIKLDDQKVYLAKNNNFLLRYQSLRDHNDDFLMVILYRDPLTHAASLMEKHQEYMRLQREDPFVLEYMDWLGHHEFGLHQKPFVFVHSAEIPEEDKDSLDYWLKIWINYYRYVLGINHPRTILVNYDSYCKYPRETIESILGRTGLSTRLPEYAPFQNKRKPGHRYSPEVFHMAGKIYEQLCEKAGIV